MKVFEAASERNAALRSSGMVQLKTDEAPAELVFCRRAWSLFVPRPSLRGRAAPRVSYTLSMLNPTVSVRHIKIDREEPCGLCGSSFVAAEDSGSRVLTIKTADDSFAALMCGGCFSKWSHGATATFRRPVSL